MRTPAGALWPACHREGDPDVLGIGECSVDHVCTVERIPAPGSKASLHRYALQPGGTVATALLACRRLGLSAAFAGAVGEDAAAHLALAPLEAEGIDLQRVQAIAQAPTRLAVILVEATSGERRVLGYRDPRLHLDAAAPREGWIGRPRALLVDPSEMETARAAAVQARGLGIPVVLDADAVEPGLSRLLPHVDFPIVSKEFAEQFSETGSPREALRHLLDFGARLAVVTLGAQGALALDRERGEVTVPAFEISPVDTTGAGDVFHAGFLWALLAGDTVETVLRRASAAAALSCLAPGAQGALPTAAEIDALVESRREGR